MDRQAKELELGAQILKDIGVRRMRVLSAPKQMHGISAFDLEIDERAGAIAGLVGAVAFAGTAQSRSSSVS